jgi:DNA repair protein RecO (recombination protein O)
MALFKTEGVVLRRRDLGEADRLLTLFTKRFGKIKAVAKGCRKPKSRLAGHLEPLNVAQFMLWRREGRDLALLRSADMTEMHPVLAGDFRAFAAASAAAELIDVSLAEDEPVPKLYALLSRFLRALKTPEHSTAALLAFMVRATDILGYAMSLETCVGCRARLASGEAWLEYRLGGLLCPECVIGERRAGERVSREVIGAMRSASADPPRAAAGEAATLGVRVLDRLLSYHQDRRVLQAERLLGIMA